MNLNKNDFYYGALLSKLVNSGFAPAIVEKEVKDARLYLVSNDYGDYSIYTKYISNADANRKNEKRWDFLFNASEINYLKEKVDEQPIIALICGQKNLIDSKIAFLLFDEFKDCIGREYQTPNRYVRIKHLKGSKYFTAYGTGLDGVKDYVRIRSNITRSLEELKMVGRKIENEFMAIE